MSKGIFNGHVKLDSVRTYNNQERRVKMVPASLPKTSGLRLLSYCNQSYSGGIAFRPLLSICSSASYYYSAAKAYGQQRRNNSCNDISIANTPSLSLSISSLGRKEASCVISKSSRTFCTASSVAADPSTPPTSSDDNKAKDEGVVDMMKVKDMANTLDIRVGKILKAWRHEEADSLYVEEVDIGEPEPRIICSGLVKYIPLDDLQDKSVVVLANLKPRNMRGVKSSGMLMAASDASHENVELLEPPEGVVPGERIWFGTGDEKDTLPEAASPNQIAKKKIWEQVQPHLCTNASSVATLGGTHLMLTSAGSVVSKTLINANIA
ncbi:Nucleic acid-binding, OB-fold [Cynara cardunculus var. scolymus]|uniref:Nucleic acid-binding, OB-fold n=2 Tax=Cynara cardunculus var. scolymus TaxID=59895 RepID=A0A103XDJ5_CYNCS|nr:Nucleic acid-binding, OB-fold [Cynara cardunculus var. scolymus]